eukprot:gene11724-8355_t
MDEFSGITVLITGIERLAAILDTFSPTHDCISPLSLEDVADHYATMIEVMEAPESLKDLGDFGVLILENGQDIVLPLSAFEPIKITIDELEESRNFDMKADAHMNPSAALARNLAAELIQAAYRVLKRNKSKSSQGSLQLSTQPADDESLPTASQSIASARIQAPDIEATTPSVSQQTERPPHVSPAKHHVPIIASLANVLEIKDVSVHAVPNVVWNDKNSLYIGFHVHDFHFRLRTQHGAGAETSWAGVLCRLGLQQLLSKNGKDTKLIIELYNEHLAIKDKLIGQCEVACSQILDQVMSDAHVDISAEFYEPAASSSASLNNSRKPRGTFACTFHLADGVPSQSNWHPDNDAKGDSVPPTARSRVVDVAADSIPEINGVTPRTIRAAADVLSAWEDNNTREPSSSTDHPTGANAHGHPEDDEDLAPPSGLSTARLSNITDDENLTAHDQPATSATSVTSGSRRVHEYHHTKPSAATAATASGHTRRMSSSSGSKHSKRIHSDVYNSRQGYLPPTSAATATTATTVAAAAAATVVPVIVDVESFFDKCYLMAFHTVCAKLEMSAREVVILLDSLGHAVAPHWLEDAATTMILPGGLLSSSASSTANHSQSMASLPFPTVTLPITHPAAFADAISQYVQQYPDLLDPAHFFAFTLDHASLAIAHLLRLIKGQYATVREQIFRASNHLADRTAPTAALSGTRRGSVARAAAGGMTLRPQQYDQATCQRLLQAMEMPAAMAEIAHSGIVLFHLDALQTQGSSASALPTLSSFAHRISSMDSVLSASGPPMGHSSSSTSAMMATIPVRHLLKSSLKRARFTVYQTALRLVDAMWDQGARPWDPYPPNGARSSSSATGTSDGPAQVNALGGGGGGGGGGTAAAAVAASSVAMKRRKSLATATSSSSSTSTGSSFIIAEAGKLFEALVPLNRAYGLGYTLQDLSQIANTVGGFLCLKETQQTTTTTATPAAPSPSLVVVKVLFPSREIKQHAVQALATLTAPTGLVQLRARGPVAAAAAIKADTDSHVLSLRDDVIDQLTTATMTATGEDKAATAIDVDVLVCLPRTCLDSTSIGVSKLLRMSRGTLDHDDVQLGMRLRVVDIATLQRLCERYEWYDRPTPATLQQLAGHRVEVVSVAELASKGRIGVKLLRDEHVCDALPLEAFTKLPTNATNVSALEAEAIIGANGDAADAPVGDAASASASAAGEAKKSGRRKSRLRHRRSSKDGSKEPGAAATTATLLADLAAMQNRAERQAPPTTTTTTTTTAASAAIAAQPSAGDETLPPSSSSAGPSKAAASTKKRNAWAAEPTVRVSSPRVSSVDRSHRVRPTSAVAPVTGGSARVSQAKLRPSSAGATHRGAQPPTTTKRTAAMSPPSPQDKDYSWLKSPKSLVDERLAAVQPTPPAVVPRSLAEVLQSEGAADHAAAAAAAAAPPGAGPTPSQVVYRSQKSVAAPTSSSSGRRTAAPLRQWQPQFRTDEAEYTAGVYVYPPHDDHDHAAREGHGAAEDVVEDRRPSPAAASPTGHPAEHHFTTFELPLPPAGDAAHAKPSPLRRPSSATGGGGGGGGGGVTATSPAAVQRVAQKLKERQRQERDAAAHERHTKTTPYQKYHESPPSSPPTDGGWGLAGVGYTGGGGRKDTAAYEFTLDEGFLEDPALRERQRKVQQVRGQQTHHHSKEASKATLKQLFGINVNDHKPVASDDDEEAPRPRPGVDATMLGDPKEHDGDGAHAQKRPQSSSNTKRKRPTPATATRPSSSAVAAPTGGAVDATSPPASPNAERYRDIETARTTKEAAYKEKYLLKQLKKLSV